MKKKLQLSETQLVEFIENTVRRIKKERQSKVVKLSENDLYKIVDKVAAQGKLINEVQGVNAERIAKELYDAMDGPGTDENKFFTAIQPTGRQGLTTDEMNAVKTAYKNLYDEDLCNRLPGDFGGNELRKAQEALGCETDSLNESISKGRFKKLRENRRLSKVFSSSGKGNRKKIIKEQGIPFDLADLSSDVVSTIKNCIWGNISLWGDRKMLTKVPASCYFAWMETPNPLNPTKSQKACLTELPKAITDDAELRGKFMAKIPTIIQCVLKSQGQTLSSTITKSLGDIWTAGKGMFGLDESNKKRNKK